MKERSKVESCIDFEIHIHEPEPDGSHPITVRVTEQDRRGSGSFTSPFNAAEVGRALSWMEQGLFDEGFVKQFGASLFRALFVDEVLDVYEGTRDGSTLPLRLRLVIDSPAASRLPWELLFDPKREVFLALEGPLVRNTSLVEPARNLEPVPVLRILVTGAFPQGVPVIEHQLETEGIRQALSGLEKRGRVEIQTLNHTSLRKLQNALREAENPEDPHPIHVLHFIGHGQYEQSSNRALLLFEDEEGKIDEVDPETLANILRSHNLKLVFLNACQSLQTPTLEITDGFASTLMSSGIPAVIGMQVSVLDDIAKQFARDFYESLADNRPVDAALVDARRLLRGSQQRRKADMGIPVCYLRSLNGQILEIQAPAAVPLTRSTWRPWLQEQIRPRKVMAASLGMITFASTLLGLYLGLRQVFSPEVTPIPPMTGDFRVAVAEFNEVNDRGEVVASRDGLVFAQDVYEGIDTALEDLRAAGFDMPIRPPALTGRVDGTNPIQRSENAAELAETTGADLVIYGHLDNAGSGTDVVLEFYLSERLLRLAEEISGSHGWSTTGVQEDIGGNAAARKILRDSLAENTRVLTQVVIGIGYYELDRFGDAERYFIEAEKMSGTSSPGNREIRKAILLLLGSTAAQRNDFTQAQSYFQEALDLDPSYARALLGEANTLSLSQINSGCLADRVNPEILAEAEEAFLNLRARPHPPGADIPAKLSLGLARVYMCFGISGFADHWQEAEQEYDFIIGEYEGGNTRLRDLAAEAHADLGLIEIVKTENINPSNQLRAVDEYKQAISLSPHSDRKAVFYTSLANTHLLIGACVQAEESLLDADETYNRFTQANPKIRRNDFESFYQQVTEKWEIQCGTGNGG